MVFGCTILDHNDTGCPLWLYQNEYKHIRYKNGLTICRRPLKNLSMMHILRDSVTQCTMRAEATIMASQILY
ncbi:hypothetical protein AFERRI_10028 [Acidithiobacillus ferrivorans]|uniref:Uncharacterized protein n=1 Tax=Acidithiobacillus ferrivorans TaxID=160808 RepID=A0A060V048_9PROT|nr:hypothetical protein AFERRI_10028 [Acidithiobacillus ferrivorans]